MSSREGLLHVTQTMCAFGCRVDVANVEGDTAMHLAARAGHLEIVRYYSREILDVYKTVLKIVAVIHCEFPVLCKQGRIHDISRS